MAKVKFVGQGTFELVDGDKSSLFTTGTALDVREDLATDLLSRQEGGKPVWERVDGEGPQVSAGPQVDGTGQAGQAPNADEAKKSKASK